MRVLIVHAHHEPKSFCSALFRQAVQTLSEAGHEVVISDLYSERFDPISDRRNFSSVFDAGYLKRIANAFTGRQAIRYGERQRPEHRSISLLIDAQVADAPRTVPEVAPLSRKCICNLL